MAKKDCRLVVNCAEDVGIMNADLIKMRQILYNLLSNAVKFTEKGTIEIAVDRKSEPDGDWIQFRVSDTGIGMSQEQMTRLFQPFTQADPSTTLKYGGTGLGLAISRSICRMMKGEINAESVLGSGSTFTVRLPADVASTPATAVARQTPDGVMASSSPSSEVPSEKTVLIIDDDSLSREVTARILKHEGFSSVWASNGQDGVRLAREVHPIAITLDVVLPGMDGWAVLTALKSDADLARIPVIMLTMTDDEGFGDALGAAEYLIKPIHSARLVEVVKKHALRKPKADAAEPEAVAHV
jgi:CheY-like chemotaxis protein/anti-sigma regulatory factor (Ser/Thr protein kinase)